VLYRFNTWCRLRGCRSACARPSGMTIAQHTLYYNCDALQRRARPSNVHNIIIRIIIDIVYSSRPRSELTPPYTVLRVLYNFCFYGLFFHRANDSRPLLHTWMHRRSNWTKSVLTIYKKKKNAISRLPVGVQAHGRTQLYTYTQRLDYSSGRRNENITNTYYHIQGVSTITYLAKSRSAQTV